MSDGEERSVPRRTFLDYLLGIGVVGTVGSIGFPILRYLEPLPRSSGGGPTRLSEDEVSKLGGTDRYVITRLGDRRVIVFEDESQKVRALAAKCTHEGCIVQFVPGESIIWCACHNGRYDLDGRVLSGPPPKPLAEFAVRLDEDGGITVDETPA